MMSDSDPSRRILRSTWVGEIGWWFVYLLVVLIASRPLGASLFSAIPLGSESEATVPLLNVWTLWWNSDRAAAGFRHYWDAPIFFPTRGTFAFSESQPTMILAAPIAWMSGNRVLAYNVYLLMVLSLNGWSCRRLLRRVGHQLWPAFCGGVMCALLPFVWWQLGVVQLTTVFGIIWTIHALVDVFEPQADTATKAISDRLVRTRHIVARLIQPPATMKRSSQDPSADHSENPQDATVPWLDVVVRGLRLGGSFCVTYCLCNYWGLFLALLVVPSSIWLWNRRLIQLRFWCEVVVAACLVLVLVGPIVLVQRSLASQHHWTREQSLIRDLSAHPRDYLDTPRTQSPSPQPVQPSEGQGAGVPPNDSERVAWTMIPQLEFPEGNRADLWPLGGGSFKLLLAPLGLVSALLTRRRRRWGLFVTTIAAFAFGISLGPKVWIAEWVPVVRGLCPYEFLQHYIPGFALIRSPFRFALFVQLAVAWLSVEALDLFDPRRWSRQVPNHEADIAPATEPSAESGTMQPSAVRSAKPSISPILATLIEWPRPVAILCLTAMVLLGLIAVFEVRPPRQRLYTDATSRPRPVWVMWLRENSAPTDAVACLPFPNGYSVHDYQETSEWMYWGTLHGRPLVNGYSGFFPEPFVTLKDQLRVGKEGSMPQLKLYPWDSPGLKQLNASGARFVIVKRSFATRDDVWEHTVTKFRWAWVTGDEMHQLDIYEIQSP